MYICTSADAFVGKSMCLWCAAGGAESLSLVDVGSALESGMLYGKGAVHHPCVSVVTVGVAASAVVLQ